MGNNKEVRRKLKTKKLSFLGQDITFIFYVTNTGRFEVDLPVNLAELANEKTLSADKLDSLDNKLEILSKKFRESKTERNKVIRYAFRGTGYIMRDGQVVWQAKDISFAEGLTLSLVAFVATEEIVTTTGGKKSFLYRTEPSSIPYSLKGEIRGNYGGTSERPDDVLDWTQEREDYFAAMGRAMEQLVLNVEKLKDPKQLLLAVQEKRLLTGPAETQQETVARHIKTMVAELPKKKGK